MSRKFNVSTRVLSLLLFSMFAQDSLLAQTLPTWFGWPTWTRPGWLSSSNNHPVPTVANVSSLFVGMPPSDQHLSVGFNERLKLKVASNHDSAKIFLDEGLRVRVFPLNWYENRPHSAHVTPSGCAVYLTSLLDLQFVEGVDGVLVFSQFFDEKWLTLTASGTGVAPEKYLFVLEHNGPKDNEFRIMSSDLDQYFSSGFVVEVNMASAKESDLIEKVRQAYKNSRGQLGEQLWGIVYRNERLPCNTFQRVIAKTDTVDVASGELTECTRPEGEQSSI